MKLELSFAVKTRTYATHNFGNDASVPESLNLIKSYSMYAVLIAKIFGLA